MAEGTVSNVFAVEQGRVSTPPLSAPILPGITRKTVLSLARELGIPCTEEAIPQERHTSASEVFLTNAIMEVLPVVRIGQGRIGNGKPGPIARALHEAYREASGPARPTTER